VVDSNKQKIDWLESGEVWDFGRNVESRLNIVAEIDSHERRRSGSVGLDIFASQMTQIL
jgi:hypothetical protein